MPTFIATGGDLETIQGVRGGQLAADRRLRLADVPVAPAPDPDAGLTVGQKAERHGVSKRTIYRRQARAREGAAAAA